MCDKKLVVCPHKTNEQGEVNFQPISTYLEFLLTICEWANDKLIHKQTTQGISLHIVPTLIDVLPKLCDEKLVIVCPHWLMFCQNCEVKNLLFCAYIDWGFANFFVVKNLLFCLHKTSGQEVKRSLQFASSQSKFLWQQRTGEWQTNLQAKIRKWLA